MWKGGRVSSGTETAASWNHLSAFWAVTDLAGLDALTELDASMAEWTSEAVIGDSDGYNGGRANFYLYDHPADQRFVWIENDLDTVLDRDFLAPNTTPVFSTM